jgi:hypothetical protein
VPAGGTIRPAPGRLGHHPAGTMTGVRRDSLDWDRLTGVTPAPAKSQEAWPETEPLGLTDPLARAAVERRQASASRWTRCRNDGCGVVHPAPFGVLPPLLLQG